MHMNQVALRAGAGFGVAFLAACSDSRRHRATSFPKTSFAVGDVTNPPADAAGWQDLPV